MKLPRLPTREAALLSLLLAASPVSSMLSCEKMVIDKVKFNLKALGGPHSVVTTQYEPPNHLNTSYTVDICAPLKRKGDVKKEEQCPNGTRVCGIKRIVEGDTNMIEKVIPISYAQHGQPLEWSASRLKDSESNTDRGKEGIRLSLEGGKYAGVKQKAIIEFLCDPDKEGTEGELKPEDDEYDPDGGKEEEGEEAQRKLRKSKRDDDKEDDGDKGDPGAGKEEQVRKDGAALKFISYGPESNSGWEGEVLRLEWATKHACEAKRGVDGDESSHWGFFTWLVIIVFLGVSAYLIFGSWLNYTRYGARGWDLVPHGDTIRDIPYLMKDWTRSVLNTVQGSGTRGGYSAV